MPIYHVAGVLQVHGNKYMPGGWVASRLGINPLIVSRITGTVFLTPGSAKKLPATLSNNRANVGLGLKFNKSNQEVSHQQTWLNCRLCLQG